MTDMHHATPPGPLSFVLLNLDGGPAVDVVLPRIAEALTESIATFASFWPASAVVRVGVSPVDRKPGEVAINIRADVLTEAPGAAAYHQVVGGVPDIEVSVAAFYGLTDGADPLSVGIDHELKETLGDLGANEWATGADGVTARAKEMCDEVQNTSYPASNGVLLSNFLLPSAFIPGAGAPWDYLTCKVSAEDASQGYAIVAQVLNETEVEAHALGHGPRGAHVHQGRLVHITGGELSEKQLLRKQSPTSRTFRRGVRL